MRSFRQFHLTSHKMPRLARNLHVVTTRRWQGDSQKTREAKRLKWCACHAKWRRGSPKCCAGQLIFWKRREPATKKQHVMKHVDVEMSQSATPATRNEATRRLKPPKAIAFAELATGTVILLSRRSLADTCERLKAQRTRFNPQTPKVKREPFAAFRNKCKLCCLLDVSGTDRKERNPYCQLARRKNHHYITGTPFKPNKKQFQYSA